VFFVPPRSASGSVRQTNGSEDPDPHQNVTDPQHCIAEYLFISWSGSSETAEFQLKMGLAEEVFGNRSSTSQIDLHGNPYACDCHLMPLFDWLKTTRARLVNKVKHNRRSKVSFFPPKMSGNPHKLLC
jgi:hypothetical protein